MKDQKNHSKDVDKSKSKEYTQVGENTTSDGLKDTSCVTGISNPIHRFFSGVQYYCDKVADYFANKPGGGNDGYMPGM
jgi:hypothetical protein